MSTRNFRPTLILALFLSCCLMASAASLRVTVKDPSGAVVPGAAVRVETEAGGIVGTKITGKDGTTIFDDLPAGAYTVRVQAEGFADGETAAAVKEGENSVDVALKIASQETAVEVGSKISSLANSDPNYQALRYGALTESYVVENLELKRDVGTFTFKSGTISFTAPVLGRVVNAVFSGQGSFHLTPAMGLEANHMAFITGQREFQEDFDAAVLMFSDGTYAELKQSLKTHAEAPHAAGLLRELRNHVRRYAEIPRTMTEYFLQGEGVSNLDAELLTDLYNPAFAGSFSAFIHGHRHGDLRFFVKPRGAFPQLLSVEETGLASVDVVGSQDGIFYLTHYLSEWRNGSASNDEDKRIATPLHYKIETVIGKNTHLASVAVVTVQPLRQGDRLIHFDLLPNLRVSRVSVGGKDIGYIQEPRRLDSSLYVVMPEPMVKGKPQDIQIEYAGDKVVRDEGGGSFSVRARTSWYPSMNVFRDRATYDLTFKVPRRYTLVGVGKLAGQSREDDFAVTHWVSDVPLAVAGFNYGEFKLKQKTDEETKYDIEAYATSELPNYLRAASEHAAMTPSAMANDAIIDAENSIRTYTYWFGPIPYGRIAITQQPQPNFGQSWPTLVYLPLFSFLDSTQRYMIMGSHTFMMNDFIQEVPSHEVSHQWWGHLVGWSSYHDQWLSEGFADFSASLFLEATSKKRDDYLKYWEHARKHIIDKTSFGFSPNDAGPIWMGIRLNTFKTEGAYNNLVYPKGGFIPHMLRYLMEDQKTGNADFVAMMHDFTATYAQKNASTEDFRAIVEKHMKPAMNLDGDGHMNWFFNQFVYGTEIGSYHLAYKITPDEGGKVIFSGKLTQSGVSEHFRVRMPIYVDFGRQGGPVKMINAGVAGNSTTQEIRIRLPEKPKKILLNYNYDVLARETSVEEQ